MLVEAGAGGMAIITMLINFHMYNIYNLDIVITTLYLCVYADGARNQHILRDVLRLFEVE